ncbi:MAG: Transcriptional regulatory protein YpdB [Pseudomonadota bacterium]|jgi:DNA-binding LytR/AlgR family response regulator
MVEKIIHALIADDEPALAKYLQTKLATLWPELKIIALAPNGLEALRIIDDENPDIAFLDIKMPGLTGLEVAQRIDRKARLVFVTAYDQYAVDAFEHEAVDYLLKPVTDERLSKCITRLKQQLATNAAPPEISALLQKLASILPKQGEGFLRWIRASVGPNVRLIPAEEILYFQAADKYTAVITQDGEALIRLSIKELTDQLDPHQFWQVHRSTIVNVQQIASTTRDEAGHVLVKIKSHAQTLQVSRGYAHLFRQM